MANEKQKAPDQKITQNSPDCSRRNPFFGEKLEHIQSEAVPKQDQLVRKHLLENIGVRQAKPRSENLIVLSCSAVNGWATMQLRSFLWLLDRLGVDYTYLQLPEKEYCCGWTTVRNSNGDEKVKAYDFSKYFIGLNIEQARKIGVKRMFYFCRWCNTA